MEYPNLDRVLAEWTCVTSALFQDGREGVLFFGENGPHFEDQELRDVLRLATLKDVSRLPINTFGAIGDTIPMLTDKAFIWLLPILLLFGSLSEEPVYAMSVVNGLRQRLPESDDWIAIKRKVSSQTFEWMYSLSSKCCFLGWQDEKRIRKRLNSCREILSV